MMMMARPSSAILLAVFASVALWSVSQGTPIVAKTNFELIILHNNDMHARFVETDGYSNACTDQQALDKKCFGGFARVAHIVRETRKESKNVLYLNAGDTYTGTPWFSLFKYNITSRMMNILKPDAISLGNHEFDDGVAGLVPFLKAVDFPVLATNLDLSKTPEMTNIPALKKSTVFTVDNHQVGVIGYLTPDTKNLVASMTVDFIDEVAAINAEAELLKSQGVNIIIALGHSGIVQDQEIARQCPLVDLVIGGHSHTFLYSDVPPTSDTPYGPYPIVVTQPASNKRVPVVQAYAFTKYLGKLSLEFDDSGNLLSWLGEPILLNATVPQDADVVSALDEYRGEVQQYENTIVGQTKVLLQGNSCRLGECNMGNLLTDAMVHIRAGLYNQNDPSQWTDAAIALIQGGGIRTSIDSVTSGNGDITRGQLDTVIPFENNVIVIEITGKVLREALEHSVSRYNKDTGVAEFLQVSGIQVTYDLDKDANSRIASVAVLCADCDVPKYVELVETKKYGVIVSDFLHTGGDGFNMLEGAPIIYTFPANQIDTIQNYLEKYSPVYPAMEERVQLKGAAGIMSLSLGLIVGSVLLNLKFN